MIASVRHEQCTKKRRNRNTIHNHIHNDIPNSGSTDLAYDCESCPISAEDETRMATRGEDGAMGNGCDPTGTSHEKEKVGMVQACGKKT